MKFRNAADTPISPRMKALAKEGCRVWTRSRSGHERWEAGDIVNVTIIDERGRLDTVIPS
jgi:hypothetical protein